MTHADDDGLVVPPKVAPTHVVILPVTPKEETRAQVLEACDQLSKELRDQEFAGGSIRVEIDDRDLRGGEKYWSWVKKGIPLTIEIGPRDLENGTVFVGRRDHGSKREGMERQALLSWPALSWLCFRGRGCAVWAVFWWSVPRLPTTSVA